MRLFHKLYAFLFGYFWMKCPRCGKYFGGHEKAGDPMMTDSHTGWGTCCKASQAEIDKYNSIIRHGYAEKARQALSEDGK